VQKKIAGVQVHIQLFCVSLQSILVFRFHSFGGGMKRESGANPEQTRCCKLQQKFLGNAHATVP
jgi:hypothetical protein